MPKPLRIYFDQDKCYYISVEKSFDRILEKFEKSIGEPILKIEHQTATVGEDYILLTVLIQY